MEIDAASRARLALVYPDLATRWIRAANSFFELHKMQIRVSEGLRTFAYQEKLYAQGRTAPGKIVTYSRAGESIHHYGLAIDSCFVGTDPFLEQLEKKDAKRAEFLWNEYGRLAEGFGLVWGGHFSKIVDRPHVQITFTLKLADLKALYARDGLKAVWARCDQVRGVRVASEWGQGRIVQLGQLPGSPLQFSSGTIA